MRVICTRCGVPNEVVEPEAPAPRIEPKIAQAHGSLMPTNGATGVTEKAAVAE